MPETPGCSSPLEIDGEKVVASARALHYKWSSDGAIFLTESGRFWTCDHGRLKPLTRAEVARQVDHQLSDTLDLSRLLVQADDIRSG